MTGHPHYERTERAVVYVTPGTFTIGAGMTAFLPSPPAMIAGIAISLVSCAAFATVHCMRFNRRRREQHKKQEVC